MKTRPNKKQTLVIWQLGEGSIKTFSFPLPGYRTVLLTSIFLLFTFSTALLFSPVDSASGTVRFFSETKSPEGFRQRNYRLLRRLYAKQEEIHEMISSGTEFQCETTEEPSLECGLSASLSSLDMASAYDTEIRFLPHRWPVQTSSLYVTSRYGFRPSTSGRGMEFHDGLDIRALRREEVLAGAAGYVEEVRKSNSGYGNFVKILHAGGYETRYAHLESIAVEQGSSVEAGQVIGIAGSTGKTTGPHLHYEVRLNGTPLDPRDYISFR